MTGAISTADGNGAWQIRITCGTSFCKPGTQPSSAWMQTMASLHPPIRMSLSKGRGKNRHDSSRSAAGYQNQLDRTVARLKIAGWTLELGMPAMHNCLPVRMLLRRTPSMAGSRYQDIFIVLVCLNAPIYVHGCGNHGTLISQMSFALGRQMINPRSPLSIAVKHLSGCGKLTRIFLSNRSLLPSEGLSSGSSTSHRPRPLRAIRSAASLPLSAATHFTGTICMFMPSSGAVLTDLGP